VLRGASPLLRAAGVLDALWQFSQVKNSNDPNAIQAVMSLGGVLEGGPGAKAARTSKELRPRRAQLAPSQM
jgi:hypothetical protein